MNRRTFLGGGIAAVAAAVEAPFYKRNLLFFIDAAGRKRPVRTQVNGCNAWRACAPVCNR